MDTRAVLEIQLGVNSKNPQLCIKSTIVDFYPKLLFLSTVVDFEQSTIVDP